MRTGILLHTRLGSELLNETQTQKPVKPGTKLFHTMGVYRDGSRKNNGVIEEHLADHIEYNKTMRPGRALFVDGVCHNKGYLSEEECDQKQKPVHVENYFTKIYSNLLMMQYLRQGIHIICQ